MKKLVMLFLVGCLISPAVFAGETIKLAAANTNDSGSYQLAANANDDIDNGRGLIFRDAASNASSKGLTIGAGAVAITAIVVGIVTSFRSTSHH